MFGGISHEQLRVSGIPKLIVSACFMIYCNTLQSNLHELCKPALTMETCSHVLQCLLHPGLDAAIHYFRGMPCNADWRGYQVRTVERAPALGQTQMEAMLIRASWHSKST